MNTRYPEYKQLTSDAINAIWGKAVIVLDTNILLNLYRYSEETRDDILAVMESMKDRLWMLYQVGLEYFNNRINTFTAPYKETVTLSLIREIRRMNGARYVRAVEGESWASLAAEYHLSEKQILRFNDIAAPTALQPGTIVYLDRKKPEAEPGYGLYQVDQEGLTLWDVSQMFGIQLKKLQLYNIFRGNAPLEVGDTVVLRKLK